MANLTLPRQTTYSGQSYIPAPSYDSFTARFGHAFPKPQFLESDLGITALYDLQPPSGNSKQQVLIVHGACTPALGMISLSRELQRLNPDMHVALYDLWGHGLSSTPLTSHTPAIFHAQIFQVLGQMRWSQAHILGFSFGGTTAMSFAVYNPNIPLSVTLAGSAGLMPSDIGGPEVTRLLAAEGDDTEAIAAVQEWLEGGPLVVPEDWKEKMEKGEVVAHALRKWELDEHQGYGHSVLSMARFGGIFEREELFGRSAKLSVSKLGIIGENDEVCSKEQLESVGLDRVESIAGAGHDFIRIRAVEVARILNVFWREQ